MRLLACEAGADDAMTLGDGRSTWEGDTRFQPDLDYDAWRLLRIPVCRTQSSANPLDHAHNSRYIRFKRNLVVLDHMAGTTFLACFAVLLIWLISEVLSMWLEVPTATADVAYAVSYDPLASGSMTAVNLRRLQSKLERLGLNPGVVDGIAGGRTLDALNRYRETKNLPRASKIDSATTAGLLD